MAKYFAIVSCDITDEFEVDITFCIENNYTENEIESYVADVAADLLLSKMSRDPYYYEGLIFVNEVGVIDE